MKTSRVLVGALCAAGFTLAGAGIASAGESTGNGGKTPVGRHEVPASICAFSGLNDVPDGSDAPDDPFAAGKVQSFGDIVQEASKMQRKGASSWVPLITNGGPGDSCKPGAEH
jgi:hypothetical protein